MSQSMNHCEHLKAILLAEGRHALEQNAELTTHVQNCADCQQLLQAWEKIPQLLEQLPEHEPGAEVLQAVSDAAGASVKKNNNGNRRRLLAPSLASAAVLLAAVGLSRELLMREAPKVPVSMEQNRVAGQTVRGPESETRSEFFEDTFGKDQKQSGINQPKSAELGRLEESMDRDGQERSLSDSPQRAGSAIEVDTLTTGNRRGRHVQQAQEAESALGDEVTLRRPEKSAPEPRLVLPNAPPVPVYEFENDPDTEFGSRENRGIDQHGEFKRLQADKQEGDSRLDNSSVVPAEQFRSSTVGGKASLKNKGSLSASNSDANTVQSIIDSDKNDIKANVEAGKHLDEPAVRDVTEPALNSSLTSNEVSARDAEIAQKERQLEKTTEDGVEKPAIIGGAGGYAQYQANGRTGVGFDFLGHYQQIENLKIQPATGYWANTYIPGDPKVRLLSSRLAQWDRSGLLNRELEQDIVPVQQPFDTPKDNALALNLMADATGVLSSNDLSAQAATRMRLQVGIRGIEHRRGQRPAMNVGVVIDLPADASDEVRIATRSLLDALLQSRLTGDRFSLVMTAQPGQTPGLIVSADDFRFGSLQLAKQIILGAEVPSAERGGISTAPPDIESGITDLSRLNLYNAIQQAGKLVQQNDDPSRPLGSSSIVLIGAKAFENTEQLLALAHQQAKAGTTISAFPLGQQVQSEQIDQLVLAGLGNRRFLDTPSQARQLVEEELHASSRAVARAARLSIRLAPGVKLIGVIGSERLDTQRAQRVREIEDSMDRRLSTNLGIQADRGDDEEGIQIVIPSIFSGDSVTVLVDILTDRPGAIADVSLRYKDLVFLRNGNLQSHLELPAIQSSTMETKRGPAELAVLKNLLTHHFVTAVEQAAAALERQQTSEAVNILRAMHATIEQVRQSLPAWSNDPDLIHDQQVLDRYIAVLDSPQASTHQSFLADSLQYAAWAKTHRALEEWK